MPGVPPPPTTRPFSPGTPATGAPAELGVEGDVAPMFDDSTADLAEALWMRLESLSGRALG